MLFSLALTPISKHLVPEGGTMEIRVGGYTLKDAHGQITALESETLEEEPNESESLQFHV